MYYRGIQWRGSSTIVLFFATNRNSPIFILKNSDWFIFFLNWNRNFLVDLLATSLGQAQLASLLLFCRSGALFGVCGFNKNYFPFKIIFSCRLLFSLRFSLVCSVFVSTTSAAVSIAFFLDLMSAVLFYHSCAFFVLLSLSYVCIQHKEALAWCSAISLCCFCFFLFFLFTKLMCCCVYVLQVWLWGFPVLVPVCAFSFPPSACFACFCWS